MSEDDGIAPATMLLIIIGAVSIGIDTYFTLMYYYYWKYPELRVDRSGKGPQYELDEENGEDNPNPSQPFPLSNLYEFTYQPGDVNQERSSWNLNINESEKRLESISDNNVAPDDKIEPNQKNSVQK